MPLRNWNDGQEITFEDLNAGQKTGLREIYDRVIYQMLQRKGDAFFGDSFLVEYATATSITVRTGLGFQVDVTQVSPEPTRRPLYRAASGPVSIATPDGSSDRIDIVVVKSAQYDEITGNRKFKNATTSVVTTESVVLQKDWEAEVLIVAGTPAGSPVEPATPAGYIKIASVLVEAVNGITVAGNITDTRTLLPLAGDALYDTQGFERLTAGAETSMDTLLADIDLYIKRGLAEYIDYQELTAGEVTALGNPAAGRHRIYNKEGTYFSKDSAGVETPLGSGAGGGGGGLKWTELAGEAPLKDVEYDTEVFLFEQGAGQKLSVALKVPQSYIAGRQILMYLAGYSPAAADEWKLQTTTTLIRTNDDPIDSTTNQRTSTNADLTNTVAKQYREFSVDVSSAIGEINSIGIQPGDIIKVELTRVAPGGTEDASDIRFIPSATEVTFA